MSCDRCKFWNGRECIDQIAYIGSDGDICCRYHIEAKPAKEVADKQLLVKTVPYLKCALVEAEIRHDQTLDFCFYERVKDISDLLDQIEAALKE